MKELFRQSREITIVKQGTMLESTHVKMMRTVVLIFSLCSLMLVAGLPVFAENTSNGKKIKLPKGHKLTFSVSREKGKTKVAEGKAATNKGPEDIAIKDKKIKLPKGHKLSFSVSREKGKKKVAVDKAVTSKRPEDITVIGKKIKLPEGHKLTFSVSRGKGKEKKVDKGRDVVAPRIKDITIKGKKIKLPKGHKLTFSVSSENEKKVEEGKVAGEKEAEDITVKGKQIKLPTGHKLTFSVSREKKKTVETGKRVTGKGPEDISLKGKKIKLPKGHKLIFRVTRKKGKKKEVVTPSRDKTPPGPPEIKDITVGGKGLLALPDGRTITGTVSREKGKAAEKPGEGDLLALPAGRTITATVSREKRKPTKKTGEEGLLALPDGRTISATVSREKGKAAEKPGVGGMLALLDGRTITATVTREKRKKARLIVKRIKPATDIDLTGCWGIVPFETSIVQSGKQVVATIPRLNWKGETIWLVYKGIYNPPVLNLAHRYTWDTLRLVDPQFDSNEKYNIILIAAELESRYRLRLHKNSHPAALHGLVLAGEMLFGSHLIDFKTSKSGFLEPFAEPNDIWLDGTAFIKGNTDSLKIKSIIVTKYDFKTKLGEVASSDRFWIKATASSGCSKVPDSFEVTVFSENDPTATVRVMLTETGPKTLEFRSLGKGLTLANLLRKDKKKRTPKAVDAKAVQKTVIKPMKDTGIFEPELEPIKIPEIEFSDLQLETMGAQGREETKGALNAIEEAEAQKTKKAEKGSAMGGKKAVAGHKEKQEIIEVGAQGGKKKARFRTRNKVTLIKEKKWLEKELKKQKKTLNHLGQARILFIRHYINNEGKEITRLETTENPELSEQGFKLYKTESVLFMRKAKEHLNKEIGKIQTDLKRIMKEMEGLG